MPVTATWDSQIANVIYYEFSGKWSWQEFLQCFEHELEMAASLDGTGYDVLAVVTRGVTLPAGPGIAHVYGIFRRYPTNHGVTVVATDNPFIRSMFGVGFKVHPDARDTFFITDALENARSIICENRAKK